jgi:hypothetical protein
MKRWFPALAALLALAWVTTVPSPSVSPVAEAASGVDIYGLDLHDGNMVKVGDTYYLYGTMYGCGFQWRVTPTKFCGFGVSTAPSLDGPWSTPQLLFDPNAVNPARGITWQTECATNGWGCFIPRMVQRTGWGANDGVWILYFSAPYDYLNNNQHQNSYWAMGCAGPAGPCGYSQNGNNPYASVYKPPMKICTQNGDPSFFVANGNLNMACTMADQTLAVEQLDKWGTNGTGIGSTMLAGLTRVESSGVYHDPASGKWVMTYADWNCGYCLATGTGYATATNPLGPWTAPGNAGWDGPPNARRLLSATSCGGQADTVVAVDGQPYQKINLWLGTANETAAGQHLEPLRFRNPDTTPNGRVWQPFDPWLC